MALLNFFPFLFSLSLSLFYKALACIKGNEAVISTLLALNANTSIANRDGLLCYDHIQDAHLKDAIMKKIALSTQHIE